MKEEIRNDGLFIVTGRGNAIDDITLNYFNHVLTKYGNLVVKNTSTDESDFLRFTELVSKDHLNHYLAKGQREVFSEGNKATYVSSGNRSIDPHVERGYDPMRPDICMFYCIQKGSEGGESLLVKGTEFYNQLKIRDQGLLEKLTKKGLMYNHVFDRETWQNRYGNEEECKKNLHANKGVRKLEINPDGSLSFEFLVDAVYCNPLSGENSILMSAISLYRYMHAAAGERIGSIRNEVFYGDGTAITDSEYQTMLETSKEVAVYYLMEPMDLLILDNNQYLHGRKAFKGDRKMLAVFGNRRSDNL